MAAYGFPLKGTPEAVCVAQLMERYKKLVETGGAAYV
jgi:hypothetical protein